MVARVNHRWTKEERELLRREYRKTQESRRELAARLGVSEFAVAAQITRMGIAKVIDRRPWTPEEDERLRRLMPHKSVRRIAKIMHRSINSVAVRAKRIQAFRHIREGWYTREEVCEILGRDPRWVQRRIDNGTLKATHHHGHDWHIEERDLRAFIRTYCHELNGRNVDLVQVVAILAGIPPV